jgi:hypothetical protein
MKRDHRGMGDLANDARLLHKAIAGFAAGEFGREKLDGDNARDQRVEGAGHSAVRADADDLQNFVAADLSQLRANWHGDVPLKKLLSLG